MIFSTTYTEILERVAQIRPGEYARTRNFIDGAVTMLSPYISRGVISTKLVLEHVLGRGYDPVRIEKFIQELAWRDYWQQVWIAKGDAIDDDLKRPQPAVANEAMPAALCDARTGIEAVDRAILELYETGYMHNHMRMYVAAIACNIGRSHWQTPARWMYYSLRDADWASNALSWQWVAGSNSHKKYVANQQNINKYCYTSQQGTFLDVTYSEFSHMDIPEVLAETCQPELVTPLERTDLTQLMIDPARRTYIYNFYNLDPVWNEGIEATRILLLEPSHFDRYPISPDTLRFAIDLSRNIEGIQIFVGEFDELSGHLPGDIYYREHPTARHYRGIEEPRDWMFPVTGDFSSFFAFWKRCKPSLKSYGQQTLFK